MIKLKNNIKLIKFQEVKEYIYQKFPNFKNRILQTPAWIKGVLFAIVFDFLIFLILNAMFPLPYHDDFSQIVKSSEGKVMYANLNTTDKWRFETKINEITPVLRKTIIFKEDKYFYYHFGINPISVVKAFFNNLFGGKRTSGASTITMQVARMIERKERSYSNKIIEIFRALQLEIKYSKEEILQMYLNLVPYGGNIEGVKTAAYFYLDQKPEALSLSQITILSIIPNFPNIISSSNFQNLYVKRNEWLKKFKLAGLFDSKTIDDAMNEPITLNRKSRPICAPHLSIRACASNPNSNEIETTIQNEIQSKSEEIIKNYIQPLIYSNISNASVMIIDNKKNEVVAYVGSSDFFNSGHQGEVDGVKSVRSPGSTLKPLLYGIAIDYGLITQKMKVSDVPITFGGYTPSNYDDKCRGLVTIEQALALSLNIPAVSILNQVGVDNFVKTMIRCGFKQVQKDQNKLGLSVILGGCGVRLEELTNLFSMIAKGGIYQKASMYKNEKKFKSNRILSEAAVYMITEILTKAERPDFPSNWAISSNAPTIAWKTGTSYGRRDAWSIGYNREYTIGVWVGNFDGRGTPELTGANIATPLLFQLFNAIDISQENLWFAPPKTIDYREVCSESGLIPEDFCENKVIDSYIPGISPNQRCNHLIEVYTNIDETVSYCKKCQPDKNIKRNLYRNLPPEVITFFEDQNIPYKKIPPHNEKCTRIFSQNAPTITSLSDGLEYILLTGEKQKLMLKASTENSVIHVWWYVNDKLLTIAKANEKVFFVPPSGNLKISCTDDKGRNSDIWINVKYI